jgi:hypothetical protein
VRRLFMQQGYSDDRILYLATDLGLPGVDALATRSNLQSAITQWALDKVGPDRPLTLYLVDHGRHDQLYLDQPRGERVRPEELDQWLAQIEAARPGLKVNVIVEACQAGSFIDLQHTVSKPGRVVLASTSALANAYARVGGGAAFSDFFLGALEQQASLYTSFQVARAAAVSLYEDQQPWLDDNGNGIPNEPGVDGVEAARRGFAYAGTLGPEEWPPYIARVEAPSSIVNGQGVIRADVRDDQRVRRVWAMIYPPSYEPPEPGDVLVQPDLPTIVLLPQGNGWYSATYTGFTEPGVYRVVVQAEDDHLLEARPVVVEVNTGRRVYLPLIVK